MRKKERIVKMDSNLFYVFLSSHYYAEGGWHDFRNKVESLQDAIDLILKQSHYEHGHVVFNDKIVFQASIDCNDDKWVIEIGVT